MVKTQKGLVRLYSFTLNIFNMGFGSLYIGISSLISVDFVNNLSYENLYSTLYSDILNFRLIVIRIYIYPSKTNKMYPIQIPLYALLLSG